MGAKEKFSWKSFVTRCARAPIWRALCLVCITAFFSLLLIDQMVMPLFSGKYAPRASIPNVVGVPADSAEKILSSAGFRADFSPPARFSSEVPENSILGQVPAAARTAKVGRTVFLTKSRGLREVVVPDLRGKSQKQATMSIVRSGLVEGEAIRGGHASIPRDVVIRTIPAGGSVVRIGDTIRVVISSGSREGVLLPNVEGWALDSAKAELERVGFVSGQVHTEKDSSGVYLPGTVIRQIPKHGEYLPKGTSIDWVISN